MKNCPKCNSDNRVWLKAGVFVVAGTESTPQGGMFQTAMVVCNACGFLEFYDSDAEILKELPQGPPRRRAAKN